MGGGDGYTILICITELKMIKMINFILCIFITIKFWKKVRGCFISRYDNLHLIRFKRKSQKLTLFYWIWNYERYQEHTGYELQKQKSEVTKKDYCTYCRSSINLAIPLFVNWYFLCLLKMKTQPSETPA